ncbi:MAG: hypothetical protein EAZ85_11205 [Bacteroidetes bacterium]|nr:MAG: hypothetical protein EAZ85_11205 [Bacteroidota bacterium]TAG87865.1 MAG: hypothetical protein EAZ20_09755 [Bacteroidota bacterium]
MKKNIVFVCIIFSIFLSHFFLLAQDREDTKKVSFVFKLDNRFSFAESQMISIHGFRTGIRLAKKHELGIALNWLGSKNIYDITNPNTLETNQGRFFYKYFGVFYEPILYKQKRWTLSFPIQFGGGKAGLNITDSKTNIFLAKREVSYSLVEPSFNVDYKIWRYVGIGSGVGYRFAFSKEAIIQNNLTRPVFILKLKIYIMEFFKKTTNEKSK